MMNTSWATAFDTSTGALVEAAFQPLHGFGKFCAVMLALGLISNSVPGTYCSSTLPSIDYYLAKITDLWNYSCYYVCPSPW